MKPGKKSITTLAFNIALLCLSTSYTDAIAQELPIKSFDVDDGLPNLRIDHLSVLDDGRIFIGAEGKPCIYDGYSFENIFADWLWFWFNAKDTNGENWYLDSKGALWKLDGKKVIGHPANDSLIALEPGLRGYPNALAFDNQNNAFISFKECTFFLKVYPNGKIEQIPVTDGLPKNSFYLETRLTNQPLFSSSPRNSNSSQRDLFINGEQIRVKDKGRTNRVRCAVRDSFMVMSGLNTLYFIEGNQVDELDIGNEITFLFIDKDQKLWIAHTKGIECMDLISRKRIRTALSGTFCTSICQDKEGFIWVGSARGLHKVLNNAITNHNNASGLVFSNEDSPVLLALNEQPLLVSGRKVFRYQKGRFVFDERSKPSALKTLRIKDSSFYHIDSRGSLLKTELNGTIRQFRDWKNINHICYLTNGNMEIIRNDSVYGLDQELNVLYSKKSPLSFNPLIDQVLISDTLGGFYFTQKDRIFHYKKNGTIDTLDFSRTSRKIGKISSIQFHNNIEFIATSSDGLWMKKGDEYFNIGRHNGLKTNEVNSTYVENDSTIWVATSKGLYQVVFSYTKSFKIKHIRILEKQDGLPSSEVKSLAVMRDTLWLSTRFGASSIDLLTYRKPITHIPASNIHWIQVNNDSARNPTSNGAEINLQYFENKISIGFRTTSFHPANKRKYTYRLIGVDSTWRETHDTVATYHSLPPGQFTFEVRTQIESNSGSISSLSIILPKAYWQRWDFIILMILLIQVIVGLGIWEYNKARRRRLRLERDKLESEIKAVRAQFNPHFMFNALGAIQQTMTSGNTKLAVSNISNLATLLRKMLNESRKSRSSLLEVEEVLKLYLDLEVMRQPGRFEYVVRLDDECQKIKELINLPIAVIQPFVENGAIHGASRAVGLGQLEVLFSVDENAYIKCLIRDNGPGFSKEVLLENKDHVSLGISLVKEQIELLNKKMDNQISLEIHSGDGINAWTEVIIKIPLDF